MLATLRIAVRRSESVRGFATTAIAMTSKANATMGHDPERFTQTVVLSNGASFTRRTTSPRPLLRLTKDTRNHPLWNPTTQTELDDESGTLSKFAKRFGDMEDLSDLSFFEMDDIPAVVARK